MDIDTCTCGHERQAHEHYRAGTDCALCPTTCARFTSEVPAWQRGLAALASLVPKRAKLAD